MAEHVVHLTRNLVAFGYKVYTVAASGRKRDVPDIRQENHGHYRPAAANVSISSQTRIEIQIYISNTAWSPETHI